MTSCINCFCLASLQEKIGQLRSCDCFVPFNYGIGFHGKIAEAQIQCWRWIAQQEEIAIEHGLGPMKRFALVRQVRRRTSETFRLDQAGTFREENQCIQTASHLQLQVFQLAFTLQRQFSLDRLPAMLFAQPPEQLLVQPDTGRTTDPAVSRTRQAALAMDRFSQCTHSHRNDRTFCRGIHQWIHHQPAFMARISAGYQKE
jgi:hypothetical protein